MYNCIRCQCSVCEAEWVVEPFEKVQLSTQTKRWWQKKALTFERDKPLHPNELSKKFHKNTIAHISTFNPNYSSNSRLIKKYIMNYKEMK